MDSESDRIRKPACMIDMQAGLRILVFNTTANTIFK